MNITNDFMDSVVQLYYGTNLPVSTVSSGSVNYYQCGYYPTYSYSQSKPSFPPENIIQDKDNKFIEIRMAVAGFKKEDIIIETEDEYLDVKGKLEKEINSDNLNFIKRNLKTDSFERRYIFPDNYFDFKNPNVSLEDGILTIRIEKNPDFVNPRKKIEIK